MVGRVVGGVGEGVGEVGVFLAMRMTRCDDLRGGCRIHSLRSIGVSMLLMLVGMGAALELSNVSCPWAGVNRKRRTMLIIM